MNVKFHYSEEVERLLKKWQSHLANYSKVLHRELFDQGWRAGELSRRIEEDEGRQQILDQIAKIRQLSIPERMEVIRCP